MKRLILISMVLTIPALASATTLFDSQGFESPTYGLGDLPGQDSWVLDENGGQSTPQVIDDPTASGMGQVAAFDATEGLGGWTGAFRAFGPSLPGVVVVEWDQYRLDTGDNLWVADAVAFDGWWAMQWDQNSQASAYFFDFGVAVGVNQWQHVTYTIDTIGGTATVDIDGSSYTAAQPDLVIGGLALELEDTAAAGNGALYLDNLQVTGIPIPEPSLFLLAGLGLLALLRRKK